MPLLAVDSLSVGYNGMEVVSNVSFTLDKGEFLAVVGPNGSGKSTLLKGLFGLADVLGGKVLFDGRDITRLAPHKRSLMGMGYLPQTGNVFEELTGRENLVLAGYDLPREDFERRLEEVLDFLPEVRGFLNRKATTLSGGERQMLALAMQLVRKPSLIMFDEPSAALAPKVVEHVFERIRMLNKGLGITVILVEQDTRRALKIAEKALLLVSGRTRFYGDAGELLARKDLVALYLGIQG
ncbi:ABC transporter ATP-binding protein [Thermofilum pendens]|uniref:ABC transporter related n=1 Tax=Thermofilum pendens (strain DSM 2475 / Hrk 5) TaxID=368408 RepID=A1RXS4_THEPD|nr:ABC transporter ATP-binding protein [Thermofilum pendens]ABL78004.1 ABC transporter related [Thermofilum pendens Hrk 5]